MRTSMRDGLIATVWRHFLAPALAAGSSLANLPSVGRFSLLGSGVAVAGAASLVAARDTRIGAIRLQATEAELGIVRILQSVYPLIETFENDTTSASNLRACVVIFEGKQGRIAYSHGDYSALERSLVWRAGDGPIGAAFDSNIVILAPESCPLPPDILDMGDDPIKWKLTSDQARSIAGKAMTATAFPMADKNGAVRAVLLLEDRRAGDRSDLRRRGVHAVLKERVAEPIRSQLAMTDFRFPEGLQREGDQS